MGNEIGDIVLVDGVYLANGLNMGRDTEMRYIKKYAEDGSIDSVILNRGDIGKGYIYDMGGYAIVMGICEIQHRGKADLESIIESRFGGEVQENYGEYPIWVYAAECYTKEFFKDFVVTWFGRDPYRELTGILGEVYESLK